MDGSENQNAPQVQAGAAARSTTEAFEEAAAAQQRPQQFVLVLYVAGTAPRSMRAIGVTRKLCEEYLPDRHDLEIVDIYQQPFLAEAAGIVAVPALVKKRPLPEIIFVGDLTNPRRVLDGLGLSASQPTGGKR